MSEYYHSPRTWDILRGIEKGFKPKDYPFELTEEELKFYREEKKGYDKCKAAIIAEGRDPSILHFVPPNDIDYHIGRGFD